MDTVNILLMVTGWLLISCAIARVVGGASDIGKTPMERWNDIRAVSDPASVTCEEDCLGLVLERVATPPAACFSAFFPRLSTHGRLAIPSSAKALGAATLQAAPRHLATPDIGFTPVG